MRAYAVNVVVDGRGTLVPAAAASLLCRLSRFFVDLGVPSIALTTLRFGVDGDIGAVDFARTLGATWSSLSETSPFRDGVAGSRVRFKDAFVGVAGMGVSGMGGGSPTAWASEGDDGERERDGYFDGESVAMYPSGRCLGWFVCCEWPFATKSNQAPLVSLPHVIVLGSPPETPPSRRSWQQDVSNFCITSSLLSCSGRRSRRRGGDGRAFLRSVQ